MDREDKILGYIEAHPLCSKTSVKNFMRDIAEGTTDKILKKLIREDKKVICIINSVNPRIHHLLINDKNKFARMNILLSKVEEELAKQKYTSAHLSTGEMISVPVDGSFGITNTTVIETIRNLIATAKGLQTLI